jgi:hypothetical protein
MDGITYHFDKLLSMQNKFSKNKSLIYTLNYSSYWLSTIIDLVVS